MKNPQDKVRGFKLVDKGINELEDGEATHPRTSGRFSGVSVGKEGGQYCIFTHRCTSPRYKKPSDIPKSMIQRIESTG